MSAQSSKMRDFCEITSSKRIFASEYVDAGVPFYRSKEVIERQAGKVDVSTEIFISESRFQEIESKFGAPQRGDLLLTSVGTLGIPYVVGDCEQFYFKDGNLTWFRKFHGLDSRYLYYWFLSPGGKAELKRATIGSSQSAYTINLLGELSIKPPSSDVQRQVVECLSAYDDLIATNQRRIALLEDAARRLYREWFVHLRFPGHELVPVKDGVPQGWQPATFADLVEINPRTPFTKEIERPFVEMSALSETSMVIGYRSMRVIGGGAKFKNGDTLLARITPCIENGKTGFVQFLEDDDAVASGSTEFIVLRSATVNPWWVYCMTREDNFREHAIRSMAGSDGRQRVNPKCFDQLAALQPPQLVLAQFEQAVKDSFAQIETLCRLNEQLAQARDLLLPKLMSGQLDVSGIPLPGGAAA